MAPVKCYYQDCINTNATKSMFSFPINDEPRLNLWIIHTDNANLASLTHQELKQRFICEDHFKADDVVKNVARSRLVPTAVPIMYKPVTSQSFRMESFSGTPVFIDVEQTPEQYLLPQEINTMIVQGPKESVASVAVTGLRTVAVTNQSVASQAASVMSVDAPSQDVKPMTSHGVIEASSEPVASQSGVQTNTHNQTEPENSYLSVVHRRVRCPECQHYTAENEEKMLRHIKKVHKGENPFQCYMCDYSTYNKTLFEEHVRIHQGIKPFKCSHCDYKSASKKNLKKHELIHRPNNPLKCEQCDFIARHPRALKRHQETHSSNDWLSFDSCKFRFRDLAAFKRHEKTHKLKCKHCGFTCCSRVFLKRHLLKEHDLSYDEALRKETFTCQVCGWMSSTMTKILLHLIHHPKQTVDENVIDLSILRKHGIM